MTLEADSLPWLLCGDVDYFMLAYTRMIAAVDGFYSNGENTTAVL